MKILIGLVLCCSVLFAETKCPELFVNGKAPISKNPVKEVCFDNYVVGYSEKFKNPLYSAEFLNVWNVLEARQIPRKNRFHVEKLPIKQSKLSAYKNSGFDRGHMTPDADMPTRNASYQSFSMLNITPQDPDNNRNAWGDMEEMVRTIAMKNNVYIISGPIFENMDRKLKDGTVIPTAYYKLIYVNNMKPKCMYIKNLPKQTHILKDIDECESLTGLHFQ